MRVAQCVDQLHVHAHLIVSFLDTAFENVRDTELLSDVAQVRWRALKTLRGCTRDDFQVSDFGQPCENFILHAFGEIGIVRIAT